MMRGDVFHGLGLVRLFVIVLVEGCKVNVV